MKSWAWAAVLILTACTKPNPRSCEDGVCDDPRWPFCDENGDIAGSPLTCIEGQCQPSAIVGCQNDDLVTCNANGTNFETTNCEFGCQGTDASASCNLCEPSTSSCNGNAIEHCGVDGRVATTEQCLGECVEDPDPRCTHIVPRYLPNACDAPAAEAELVFTNTATFDTDLDSNCNGGVILQAGAANICVVRYGRIRIPAGVDITVVGGRALALVSDTETTIEGFLDLSAGPGRNGPGGGTIRSGGFITESCGGYGGAGFATRGGHGGNSTTNGGSNNGGAAMADPATLPVLIGGPQSRENGTGSTVYGGGGGAATLVACRGIVSVPGEISAGGGGGSVNPSGYGGGAGGYMVFQGMRIELVGKLFANGGGGGSGTSPSNGGFNSGGAGKRDVMNENGGISGFGGANGGRGGNAVGVPFPGEKMPNGAGCLNLNSGGGGGGSVGFLQTYTPVGVDPAVAPVAASPMPRPNANIATD